MQIEPSCKASSMPEDHESGRPTLQAVLDAVSSPIRREILWLVWNDERAAGDIANEFEVTAPTISAHLTELRSSGLVTMRVDGNFRRYRADRDAMALLVPLLAADEARWQAADDIPERSLANSHVDHWVQVTAEVAAPPTEVFTDFADDQRYSRWMGVPVVLRDGRFSAELEWGTKVRGHYEVVAPPSLIAMRWDFEDDAIPVPGAQLVAYLRLSPTDSGTHVEVHQHAPTAAQADFLVAAWSMVLGRLRDHHQRVGDRRDAPQPVRRPRRAKRRL
jgi:DNA-binding transcriptional ArsR family regulator/uncharacterized protein YndB with AHSA1/START domain